MVNELPFINELARIFIRATKFEEQHGRLSLAARDNCEKASRLLGYILLATYRSNPSVATPAMEFLRRSLAKVYAGEQDQFLTVYTVEYVRERTEEIRAILQGVYSDREDAELDAAACGICAKISLVCNEISNEMLAQATQNRTPNRLTNYLRVVGGTST